MDNRHYCPVPVATWIHSGQDAPEKSSLEAKSSLYHFTGTNVTDNRNKTETANNCQKRKRLRISGKMINPEAIAILRGQMSRMTGVRLKQRIIVKKGRDCELAIKW